MKASRVMAWLLVLFVPGIILSAYLYASRTTRIFTVSMDYSVLAVSLAVGAAGVLMLARTTRSRFMGVALYLVIAGSGMYFSMHKVVCVALGDCP